MNIYTCHDEVHFIIQIVYGLACTDFTSWYCGGKTWGRCGAGRAIYKKASICPANWSSFLEWVRSKPPISYMHVPRSLTRLV